MRDSEQIRLLERILEELQRGNETRRAGAFDLALGGSGAGGSGGGGGDGPLALPGDALPERRGGRSNRRAIGYSGNQDDIIDATYRIVQPLSAGPMLGLPDGGGPRVNNRGFFNVQSLGSYASGSMDSESGTPYGSLAAAGFARRVFGPRGSAALGLNLPGRFSGAGAFAAAAAGGVAGGTLNAGISLIEKGVSSVGGSALSNQTRLGGPFGENVRAGAVDFLTSFPIIGSSVNDKVAPIDRAIDRATSLVTLVERGGGRVDETTRDAVTAEFLRQEYRAQAAAKEFDVTRRDLKAALGQGVANEAKDASGEVDLRKLGEILGRRISGD